MARKAKQLKKLCIKCKIDKVLTEFFVSDSQMFPDGRMNICKICLKSMVDITDIESLKDVLRSVDKPFLDYLWVKCLETKDAVGNYFRQLSSLPQYKNMNWNNSVEGSVEIKPVVRNNASQEEPQLDVEVSDELRKKWGRSFKPLDVIEFEDAYEFYKSNYQIHTSMHEVFLKKACIASVKMDKAIASGNAKEAEQYTKIFKEMTVAGKLSPRDMSKDELSGGINTFSALVAMVEKNQDIIPILPQFKEKPKDNVDLTILAYVNYVRHLFGEKPVEYRNLYEFYEGMNKDRDAEDDLEEEEVI